jgi:hypothetical protein
VERPRDRLVERDRVGRPRREDHGGRVRAVSVVRAPDERSAARSGAARGARRRGAAHANLRRGRRARARPVVQRVRRVAAHRHDQPGERRDGDGTPARHRARPRWQPGGGSAGSRARHRREHEVGRSWRVRVLGSARRHAGVGGASVRLRCRARTGRASQRAADAARTSISRRWRRSVR